MDQNRAKGTEIGQKGPKYSKMDLNRAKGPKGCIAC